MFEDTLNPMMATFKLKNAMALVIIFMISEKAFCQTQILNNTWQTFASAGTTTGPATDGTFVLYAAVGQPAATSSNVPTQTQAGILSIFSRNLSAPDKIPPVIVPSSLPASFTSGQTSFQLNVTDNVAVAATYIHFKPISFPPVFDSASLVSASPTVDSKAFSFTIGNTAWFDAMGIEYYFTAIDSKNNRARNPAGNGTYFSQLITPILSLTSLPFGTSYKIVSFPYDSAGTPYHASNIYKPTADESFARMSHYDPATKKNIEYAGHGFSTLNRGLGYWLLYAAQPSITVSKVTAPAENRDHLFQINLKAKSWNEIGNPYPVPISWSDVLALDDNKGVNKNMLSKLNVYSSGSYDSAANSILPAFTGGFINNFSNSDITLLIPFEGQAKQGIRASSFGNDISQSSWNLFMHVSESGSDIENLIGGFGMHPAALIGSDQFDNYNPPAPVSSPEVNFSHEEFADIEFGNDIVPLQKKFAWRFTSKGELGKEMELMWNSSIAAAGQQLYFVDQNKLTMVNMLTVNHYHFVQNDKTAFSIYFGFDALKDIIPEDLKIEQAYPNPLLADRVASFPIAVPDAGVPAEVHVLFFNGIGSLIASHDQTVDAGLHEVRCDLSSLQTSGIYIYKATVRQGNTYISTAGKIIVP